ncbi:sensor histidine kinase [Cohnella yongneupensis]|uniref:histidine kinase n=1 Tax=Cohnella yongneupensis TaxID=425006 RepID=A0ABW0QZS0_9BACL
MSIRMKLLISYAAMLVMPLVLMLVTVLSLLFVFRGDLQNLSNLYETQVEGFEHADYHYLLKNTISQNPELLTDNAYLNDVSEELKARNSYIIVRLDDQLKYVPDQVKDNPALLSGLMPFERSGYRHDLSTRSFGNEFYSVFQFDFLTSAQQHGSLFLLKKVDPLVYYARKYVPSMLVVLLVILIITHTLLTYLMSKSIIRPLRRLRAAAKQIKEGDLDFQVEIGRKDEIGQLGVAFEEMRYQLQHSLRLQTQYEANRKELVSNISHDLKTPITAIKGYVDGIMEGVADSPEKTEKYMRTIAAKAEEMDRLIDELFLYSKLDLKRVPFAFEHVPILALLQDWTEELQFELEKQGVKLLTELRIGTGGIVNVDRDKLKRVLTNVIQNSLKYMLNEDKVIQVRAKDSGDQLRLEIQDNGPGIDAEALPFVFDRFYRAEQSRNADTGGSGLGLAIAKQIMEGHGGDIRAESKEGQGTTIVVILPIQREGAHSQ